MGDGVRMPQYTCGVRGQLLGIHSLHPPWGPGIKLRSRLPSRNFLPSKPSLQAPIKSLVDIDRHSTLRLMMIQCVFIHNL